MQLCAPLRPLVVFFREKMVGFQFLKRLVRIYPSAYIYSEHVI